MSNPIYRLHKDNSLLDIMIQVEDYLDSLDIYTFLNWEEGELVDGPDVERYWIKYVLRYPYKDMPDPAGAERLVKYGSKVFYEKSIETVPTEEKNDQGQPKTKDLKVWLVTIQTPRRFIEEIDLRMFDPEEIPDEEDILSSVGQNITPESGVVKSTEPGAGAPVEAAAPAAGETEEIGL